MSSKTHKTKHYKIRILNKIRERLIENQDVYGLEVNNFIVKTTYFDNLLKKRKEEPENSKYKNDLNHLLVKAMFFHLYTPEKKKIYNKLLLGADRKIFFAIEVNNFLNDYFSKTEEGKDEFEKAIDSVYRTIYLANLTLN